MFNYRETSIVRGMLKRGDKQHDIAAYFGVNGGRVAEVHTKDDVWPAAPAADESALPHPGPYATRYTIDQIAQTLTEVIEILNSVGPSDGLQDVLASFVLAKEFVAAKADELAKH